MTDNPYAPPNAPVSDIDPSEVEYAGFWVRTGAALIDTALILAISFPLLFALYGWAYFDSQKSGFVAGTGDFVITWLLPAAASIVFWLTRQATPGKMLLSARVVDARTGNTLTVGQSIGRYLGYFISTLPFGLGLIWVAFDPRKQGWHDKLAGTVVIRSKRGRTQPVSFDKAPGR
jgi:uncharacterized RDD family membrane protein YckC